ncbi:HNH endonuclease signature motif containing protein [Trueperella pyogenes]
MAAHPSCEQCERDGRITPAAEVDHILPLDRGGTHDEENLQALCKPCHSAKTARQDGRWGKHGIVYAYPVTGRGPYS